jgi:hypothetical protein
VLFRSVKFKAFVLIGFVLVCLTACGPLDVKPEEWPTDRIERITGVRIPEYKVTKAFIGPTSFLGDFKDSLYIEFETLPSDELFEKIDSLNWYREGDKYSFSTSWGNGSPAPEGENDEEDRFFEIKLTKGEKTGIIVYGMW